MGQIGLLSTKSKDGLLKGNSRIKLEVILGNAVI